MEVFDLRREGRGRRGTRGKGDGCVCCCWSWRVYEMHLSDGETGEMNS